MQHTFLHTNGLFVVVCQCSVMKCVIIIINNNKRQLTLKSMPPAGDEHGVIILVTYVHVHTHDDANRKKCSCTLCVFYVPVSAQILASQARRANHLIIQHVCRAKAHVCQTGNVICFATTRRNRQPAWDKIIITIQCLSPCTDCR